MIFASVERALLAEDRLRPVKTPVIEREYFDKCDPTANKSSILTGASEENRFMSLIRPRLKGYNCTNYTIVFESKFVGIILRSKNFRTRAN